MASWGRKRIPIETLCFQREEGFSICFSQSLVIVPPILEGVSSSKHPVSGALSAIQPKSARSQAKTLACLNFYTGIYWWITINSAVCSPQLFLNTWINILLLNMHLCLFWRITWPDTQTVLPRLSFASQYSRTAIMLELPITQRKKIKTVPCTEAGRSSVATAATRKRQMKKEWWIPMARPPTQSRIITQTFVLNYI